MDKRLLLGSIKYQICVESELQFIGGFVSVVPPVSITANGADL